MTTTPNLTPNVEEAANRVRELSERVLETTKQNGLSWLEAYERVLESMLKLGQEAAQGTQVEWVNTLATTQADIVREMSQVYLGAMRQQLQK